MQKNLMFIVLMIFSINGTVLAQDIKIGEKYLMRSNLLDEERHYWVHLPVNYSADKKYPVLYVLDGDRSFSYASGVLSQLSANDKTPALIMVSILNTDRVRDLTPTHVTVDAEGSRSPDPNTTGGGKNFLEFLKTEFIPYIESKYKTEDFRILAGHSLGGLFAIYSYLEDPKLFQGYIVIDPSLWWDSNVLARRVSENAFKKSTRNNLIYLSSATNPQPNMLEGQNLFMDALNKADIDTLNMTYTHFADEHHGSVDLLSFYHGLRFIFEGWEISFQEAMENPALIDEHFTAMTNRLGYEVVPSERFIDRLAFSFMFMKNDKQKALEFFKRNVENFPNSARAHDSLGTGYRQLGDLENAIKSYEKALEIEPEKESTMQRLREVIAEKE